MFIGNTERKEKPVESFSVYWFGLNNGWKRVLSKFCSYGYKPTFVRQYILITSVGDAKPLAVHPDPYICCVVWLLHCCVNDYFCLAHFVQDAIVINLILCITEHVPVKVRTLWQVHSTPKADIWTRYEGDHTRPFRKDGGEGCGCYTTYSVVCGIFGCVDSYWTAWPRRWRHYAPPKHVVQSTPKTWSPVH